MKQQNNRYRNIISRFFIPALAILIPLMAVGGSSFNSALASAPITAPTSPSSGGAAQTAANTVVLRVYFRSTAERDRLANELDVDEASTAGGYLSAYVNRADSAAEMADLKAQGLRVEVDQKQTDNVNKAIAMFNIPWDGSPDTFFNGYRTVEENYAYMAMLASEYPTLAEVVDIGDSWCKTHPGTCTYPTNSNGYDLEVLHITNQAIAGPKPVFWYEAGIHSREIATMEVADRYMSLLLDQYNTDPDSHWLVDYTDIWVMPHVNPDGHHIVENNGGSPVYQRKNADKDDGCTTNGSFGTDNNRNFTYLWGCCNGSSGTPCNETYRGPTAGSEEETQAVMTKIASLIPDQRGPGTTDPAPITTTGVYQSMHSNASLNLYPWGYTTTQAPNYADLDNIGKHFKASNAYPSGNNYQTCAPPTCLYGVDGDSADWGYGVLGIPSFTTEVAGSDFFVNYACLDESYTLCGDSDNTIGAGIWPTNRGPLVYSAKIAGMPYLTTRGPDANTVATTPMTVTQGTPSIISGIINYNWTGNTYLQNVAAAEYYVDTPPQAGGTGIPMAGTFTSSTVNVTATIDTSALAPGRHLILVRGRGVNDYEGYHSWGPLTAAWLDILPSGGPTNTPGPATSTPTSVPSSTSTAIPSATPSIIPPTGTATSILPTVTLPIPSITVLTPSATATQVVGTATETATGTPPTATETETATETVTGTPPTATETPTVCTLAFTDVPSDSTFYTYIECLACRGIINGYPCGGAGEPCDGNNNPYFRPSNNVTRGQFAKIASNSAGFDDPAGDQQYQDVLPGSSFYDFIWRLTNRSLVGGYPCGGPGEPCVGPDNMPYYRPNSNVTRGQLSKIDSNAAGYEDEATGQQYEDVLPGSTFYDFIYRLSTRNIIAGYPCGGPVEPCGPDNLPYFRPNANATRGQASKIVSNTFFPECSASPK